MLEAAAVATAAPTEGATVRYHGSLTAFHGPARVLGMCDCEKCWEEEDYARLVGAAAPSPKWELAPRYCDGILRHVYRESFIVQAKR